MADDREDNFMKWLAHSGLLLATCCCTLQADFPYPVDSYYSGNHWSPYPPACVTVPLRQLDLYGDNVALVYEGTINLKLATNSSDTVPGRTLAPVNLKVFRIACAEADRSVILVEFTLLDKSNSLQAGRQFELPDVEGSTAFDPFPFELKPEPNTHGQTLLQQAVTLRTFGDYTDGWDDVDRFSWRYILDVSPFANFWGPYVSEYYNGSFGLGFITGPSSSSWISVPSTRSVLTPNHELPINGRLSGNWVEPGTRDQGFLLSVSTPVPPTVTAEIPEHEAMLVFLAWYTFDADGEMLWLTASGSAPQGSSTVDLDFVQVKHGEFMGPQRMQHSIVGKGRLQARNCNWLELDYDLESLGLGSDRVRLTRVFELEIAGYHCRDYRARIDSLYGAGSN
jgi:hypothetical protein